MIRRLNVRYLFETVGGFLLALALLALFFVSFATAAPRKATSHPLALLPGSAELVVSLDTFALRKSDLVAQMEQRFDSIPEAAENYRRFVQETGLDPRQDTDQVLMAMRHVGSVDATQAGFLIVAQGRFGSSHLVDTAATKGGSILQHAGGAKVWISQSEADTRGAGGKVMALAQPDEATLVFGDRQEVMRVLDILSGKTAPEVKDAALKNQLTGVDRKAPAWAILNSSALASKLSSEIGQSSGSWKPSSAISKVESVAVMGWVGRDLEVKARVATKDSETAGLVADLVRGALAAGKVAAQDNDPELLKILQETKVTQSGTTLEVEARIPASRFQDQQAKNAVK
jgi:hypothetical protein